MGQGGSCCQLGTGEVCAEEYSSEQFHQQQQQRSEASVLLQTLPATAKWKPQGGSPHKGTFRELVVSQLAERKAASFAGLVLGLGLRMRMSDQSQSTSIQNGSEVTDIAFSPDGENLLVGGEENSVTLWNVKKKSKRLEAKTSGPVTAVAFSPDGQYFAAGDASSRCTVWRGSSMEELARMGSDDGRVVSIALGSWPRSLLAISFAKGCVKLVTLPDMKCMAVLHPDGLLHGLCFSPEGGLLAGGCGTDDSFGLKTRSLASGRSSDAPCSWPVQCWRLPADPQGECQSLAKLPFQGPVHTTAFSPSGRLLAAGSEDCKVRTFLVEGNFEQVGSFTCPAGVRCLAWTSDSRFLASGGEDMQVSVWDLITEKIIMQLPHMEDWLCAVAFNPESNLLACCGFGSEGVSLQPVEVCKVGSPTAAAGSGATSPPAGHAGRLSRQGQGRVSLQEQGKVLLAGRRQNGVDITISQHFDSSSL